jgi:hypothetical protein
MKRASLILSEEDIDLIHDGLTCIAGDPDKAGLARLMERVRKARSRLATNAASGSTAPERAQAEMALE